jgi:hypothetical protein
MTDNDRPRFCSDHHWSPALPRLVENSAGQLVDHPTERMRFCANCPAEVSVERELEVTAREPCAHVWGPWETVYEGTLGGTDRRATGDRVRLCILCGKWDAQWAKEKK